VHILCNPTSQLSRHIKDVKEKEEVELAVEVKYEEFIEEYIMVEVDM
jgi:hypothetical protein